MRNKTGEIPQKMGPRKAWVVAGSLRRNGGFSGKSAPGWLKATEDCLFLDQVGLLPGAGTASFVERKRVLMKFRKRGK